MSMHAERIRNHMQLGCFRNWQFCFRRAHRAGTQSYGDGGYELTKLSASLVSIAVLGMQSSNLLLIAIVMALHQETTPP